MFSQCQWERRKPRESSQNASLTEAVALLIRGSCKDEASSLVETLHQPASPVFGTASPALGRLVLSNGGFLRLSLTICRLPQLRLMDAGSRGVDTGSCGYGGGVMFGGPAVVFDPEHGCGGTRHLLAGRLSCLEHLDEARCEKAVEPTQGKGEAPR